MHMAGSEVLPIDLERIHDATGGDPEFLAELVEIFLEDAELRLREIAGAVAAGDPGELRKTAHKLKGSSANMGADGLMSMAKSLEDMGHAGEMSVAETQLPHLEAELGRVRHALEALMAEGA
jgi:HPt (histidine-containing phosphotransfer) domain-containing protein